MKAQYEEMERQRKIFQLEIEVLGKTICELVKEKEGSTQGRMQKEGKSELIHKTLENETNQVLIGGSRHTQTNATCHFK